MQVYTDLPVARTIVPVEQFDAVGDAGLRDALLFVRGSSTPVTADDAAASLSVHRSVARSRLERLLRAGLLQATFARRSGRSGPGAGRPAKLYAPAPERSALEFPARRLAQIVGGLVEEIPAHARAGALRRVGEGYGRELAKAAGVRGSADLQRGLEGVCAGLRALGFPLTLERVGADGATISTPDCPLRPLVRDHPEAVEIDHGMWTGLVEQGVRGVAAANVNCSTTGCHGVDGACTVRLAFAPTD